jgi:hypothetical protein
VRFNPFRPGSVVGPGMFSGRGQELLTLERVLFQTRNGNPQHFLLRGERGIGKSSLLLFLQLLARGKFLSNSGYEFKFLVVNIELDPTSTFLSIIQKLAGELKRVVASQQQMKEMAKKVWDFITGWEIMGVKYQSPDGGPDFGPNELLEDLTSAIESLIPAIKPEFEGILFLIDEADKPEAEANLGEFTKLFTERLSKRGCENVALGLAGLPNVLERLAASHPSSTRVFHVLDLEPLQEADRVDVIRKGLVEAKQKNGFDIAITEEAENLISKFSEGYPHFIQQFAYSAFEADTDNSIDADDVSKGAFNPKGGAFQQLGLKYFEDLYFEKIWSDDYRKVLHAMAERVDPWVDKATIRERTGLKETTLSNALSALIERNIIVPQKGKKGVYRLPTASFAVWIRAFTQTVLKADDSAENPPT